MSYAQAIESLYARGHELAPAGSSAGTATSPRKFDLAEMRILTAALDAPELKFPSVLIAGTIISFRRDAAVRSRPGAEHDPARRP